MLHTLVRQRIKVVERDEVEARVVTVLGCLWYQIRSPRLEWLLQVRREVVKVTASIQGPWQD
jgi:hypothetical protein